MADITYDTSEMLYNQDLVKVHGTQWHNGDFGQVVAVNRPKYLVNLPGPQPMTRDQTWIHRDKLELVE